MKTSSMRNNRISRDVLSSEDVKTSSMKKDKPSLTLEVKQSERTLVSEGANASNKKQSDLDRQRSYVIRQTPKRWLSLSLSNSERQVSQKRIKKICYIF